MKKPLVELYLKRPKWCIKGKRAEHKLHAAYLSHLAWLDEKTKRDEWVARFRQRRELAKLEKEQQQQQQQEEHGQGSSTQGISSGEAA